MEIRSKNNDGAVTAILFGEIDHHNAAAARAELDRLIESEQAVKFRLDLSGVTFCDSSGLGLVMGRMKKCESLGSDFAVADPSPAAEKILNIAGMDKFIKIERNVKT